jgi:hypothetical protein
MTKAGKESREERADARSSGLTQTAKVRRPSVQNQIPQRFCTPR